MQHAEFKLDSSVAVPSRIPQQSRYRSHGKRVFDVLFSLAILPAVVPLLGLLCALVALDGAAPVFVQKRVGRGGKIFGCLKLRTMVPNADAQLAEILAACPIQLDHWRQFQKLGKDPRITWVGWVLRRTSLDELPQIFNVLRGDMSLVGPRPFTVDQRDQYQRAGGRAYYWLNPGITGTWQVEARGSTPFAERVAYDEQYWKNVSLIQDLTLIAKTLGVVCRLTGR